MAPGFYRVHLEADDDDWLTVHAALDEDGRVRATGPGPYLFKARWNGDEFYGELSLASEPRLIWGADAPDSLTDIAEVSLVEWAKVTVWQEDTRDSPRFTFRVRSMHRL